MKRFAIQIEGYHDGAKDSDFRNAIITLHRNLNEADFTVTSDRSTTDMEKAQRAAEEMKQLEAGGSA